MWAYIYNAALSLRIGNNPMIIISSKMYCHDEEEPQKKGQVPLKNKTHAAKAMTFLEKVILDNV